jgi:hypothetical protein
MNAISARIVVIAMAAKDRFVLAWQQRHDDRGLSTAEMAVIALGLIIAAGIFVAAITAVTKSLSGKIKTNAK